ARPFGKSSSSIARRDNPHANSFRQCYSEPARKRSQRVLLHAPSERGGHGSLESCYSCGRRGAVCRPSLRHALGLLVLTTPRNSALALSRVAITASGDRSSRGHAADRSTHRD